MVKTIKLTEPFLACQNRLGEGCMWDIDSQLLYWVDIKNGEVHVLDPKTMFHAIDIYENEWIPSMTFSSDGKSLLATHNTRLVYLPLPSPPTSVIPTRTVRTSLPPPAGKDFTLPEKYFVDKEGGCDRFNDGACDSKGRFWVGTMGKIPNNFLGGQLYRYDPDGTVETFLENVGVSNGLGWTRDDKTMIYIDSAKGTVDAYDFDSTNGTIPPIPRIFAPKAPFTRGTFDGLCMDAADGVWAARWGDGKVVHYLKDGTLDMIVELGGVLNVTCCIFGGEDLQTLYITTARSTESHPDKPAEWHAQYPHGGDLFCVRIDGVKGVERNRFGGKLELPGGGGKL